MTAWTEARRKRLLYRASYTGTKETDILLGRFARAHMATLTDAQLDRFEALIERGDRDLYLWISGRAPVPPDCDSDVMTMLQNFRLAP